MTDHRDDFGVDQQPELWPSPDIAMLDHMDSTHNFADCPSPDGGSQSAVSCETRHLADGGCGSPNPDGALGNGSAVNLCRSFFAGVFTASFVAMRGCLPAWKLKAKWNDVRQASPLGITAQTATESASDHTESRPRHNDP